MAMDGTDPITGWEFSGKAGEIPNIPPLDQKHYYEVVT